MERIFACGSVLGIMACVALSQPQDSRPQFEVASVKPNHSGDGQVRIRPTSGGRLTVQNASLRQLIQLAWRVEFFEITGAPTWIDSERYDIEAKAAGDVANNNLLLPMVQMLLEDRFQLKIHRETKEMPVYALVVATREPKLQAPKEGGCLKQDPNKPLPLPTPGSTPFCGTVFLFRNQMSGGAVHLADIVKQLTRLLGRQVIDRTSLTGAYDIHLEWAPDSGAGPVILSPGGGGEPGREPPLAESSGPSIFTALQEQLGLRLEAEKGPVPVIVIDHVERASEN